MSLIARRDILFRSRIYRAGEKLPADNEAMVDAWLKAESARWDDEKPEPQKAAKEKPEPKKKGKK